MAGLTRAAESDNIAVSQGAVGCRRCVPHPIVDRCEAGRAVACASLAASGKSGLGRASAQEANSVHQWRDTNKASLTEAAVYFGLSVATVKRYYKEAKKIVRQLQAERSRLRES